MKPINGFKSEAPTNGGYPMLPKGLYVAQIKAVKIDGSEPDQRLVLRLDITEGEHAGYYTKRYNADTERGGQYEVKYKGDLAIQIPNPDNKSRKYPDSDLRKFNNSIWAIEQSNDGYAWNWDEQSLKGKAVGINVQQGTFNGIQFTKIGRLESIPMIRDGKCKVMRDLPARGEASAPAADSSSNMFVVDEEVPF